EARKLWDESRAIIEQLVQSHPFDAQYSEFLAERILARAVLSYDTGHLEEAEKSFREARDVYAALVAQSPQVLAFRREHARCTHGLARVIQDSGRRDEAKAVMRDGEV